jgi:large repetitive protein
MAGGVAGTYYVVVTDRCALSDTATFLVELSEFNFSATTDPATCGDSDGSITLDPLNGVGPYNYSVDTGATYTTDNPVTGLPAGVYTVIGYDAAGCYDTIVAIINNIDGPVIDTVHVSNSLCYGDSTGWAQVFATAENGDGVLSYLWDDYLAQTSDSAFNLPSGTYIIEVTEVSNGGTVTCYTYDVITISTPDQLLPATIVTQPTCANDDGVIEIIPSGGVSPYEILNVNTGNTSSDLTYSGLDENIYAFVLIDSNGCQMPFIDTLVAGPGPVIDSLITTNVSCGGTGSPSNSDGIINVYGSGNNSPFS